MKYRPDEATLISWIYGDLDEAERAKVDTYLSENPEEMRRVRGMQFTIGAMSHAQDKEVIAPPLIMDDTTRVLPLWKNTWFRSAMSIAASFVLIVVAGRLLGPDISYNNGELLISFGNGKREQGVQTPTQQSGLTEADVRDMIDASVKVSEERMDQRLVSTQAKFNESLRRTSQATPSQVDTIVSRMSRASQAQISAFVAGLREENMLMMQQYLELSASDQRTYMENLLVDFSKWQQEQRNQDLLLFQARMNNVEQNTNQLKAETEQILASLITNSEVSANNSN
jgi:hypothetical protein